METFHETNELNTGRNVDFSCEIPERSVTGVAPEPRELQIATMSKTFVLNRKFMTKEMFWNIPLIRYSELTEGIVKKQLFVRSRSREELDDFLRRRETLTGEFPIHHLVLKHMDEFKKNKTTLLDERSLSVGTCTKDICFPTKVKRCAFSNCFIVYIRFKCDDDFLETHVKVFDKGTVEVVGVTDTAKFPLIKTFVLKFLNELDRSSSSSPPSSPLEFVKLACEERCVLINSGFSCNFPVDLDALLLLQPNNLPWTNTEGHPALKCKFFYDLEKSADDQTGHVRQSDFHVKLKKRPKLPWYAVVTFMIFRTGECLVSGNASETVIHFVHKFFRDIVCAHYAQIKYGFDGDKKPRREPTEPRIKLAVTRDFANSVCPPNKKRRLLVENSDAMDHSSLTSSGRAKLTNVERLARRRRMAARARMAKLRDVTLQPSRVPCVPIAESDDETIVSFYRRFHKCDPALLPPLAEAKSHKKQLPAVPAETVQKLSSAMRLWLK